MKKGLISEEKINTSVKRLLKARFELGEMNPTHPWSNIPYSVIDCPKHKELALKMAHESLVLLQNKNNILPLNRQMKVAVIGPNANDSVMQWGNYNGFPFTHRNFTGRNTRQTSRRTNHLRTCVRIYKRHYFA